MAIQKSQGVALSSFHFDRREFDELLTQHGTPAELRVAKRCACWLAETETPDPACNLCYPFGYLYDAPVTLKVHGPNRKPMKRIEQVGTLELGDAFFTLPSMHQPPTYARLTLTKSILTVDDILTRGREDILRFSRVLQVVSAHTSRRDDVAGGKVAVVNVPLTAGTDYVVDLATRKVTYPGGSAVAVGGRVVFVCRVASEWILWDTQDRNENNEPMPYRFLAKRLDYLLHPRGKAEEKSF